MHESATPGRPTSEMQEEFQKPTAFVFTQWLPKNWSFPCPSEGSKSHVPVSGQKGDVMQKAATTDVWQSLANSP